MQHLKADFWRRNLSNLAEQLQGSEYFRAHTAVKAGTATAQRLGAGYRA